ncbi:hypothetical protein BDN72DRAFT_905058 [Pluteus cervinus]|uniref:Uncharacterized protein n=1 Tax=Pluteus cervinus TaxID=181527 RepID=A0ACD3A3V4_9AGAR|nr:hypothetical protein BDN72DRAFT_905058 [Pluteus cervinus]
MSSMALDLLSSDAPSSPLPLGVELQVIIVQLVLDSVPVAVYHQLMGQYPKVFRRWTQRPYNRILYDDDDNEDFALRVQEFYAVIGPSYPSWRFANLNVLELPIPETQEVTALLATTFSLIQPVELNLMCGHHEYFPDYLLELTPHLAGLRVLRIKYERYVHHNDMFYPWLTKLWDMALAPLVGLRMFVLITPLPLDCMEPTMERNEQQIEREFISKLMPLLPSLDRIYAFDEDLGRGDQYRVGLSHGRDPDGAGPFDCISGMPDEDQDVFFREDNGFFDY